MELACPEGIEPPTHSLEGCCSIQLSYGQIERKKARKAFDGYLMVGAIGFEPTTLWSQTRCATRLRYTPIRRFYPHKPVVLGKQAKNALSCIKG